MAIAGVVTAILVPAIFAHLIVGGGRLAREEVGLVPVFNERAGGRFNGMNLTVPLVRFTIYDRMVVAAYGATRHVIPTTEIDKVSVRQHVISKGVHIRHHRKGTPAEFIIWSLSPQVVVDVLRNQGVRTAGD